MSGIRRSSLATSAVGTLLVSGRYSIRETMIRLRGVRIDERKARRFWPDGDAVGRRVFSPINANQLEDRRHHAVADCHRRGSHRAVERAGRARRSDRNVLHSACDDGAPRSGYVIRVDRRGRRRSRRLIRGRRSCRGAFDPIVSERTELLASRTNTMRPAMLFAPSAFLLFPAAWHACLRRDPAHA